MVSSLQAKARKAMKKTRKELPFRGEPLRKTPTTMWYKQRAWALSGLRHLRAPVAIWPSDRLAKGFKIIPQKNCCVQPFCDINSVEHEPTWTEIIGTLVSLLMGTPGLDWTHPTSHVETFAGGQAVTRGEIKARAKKRALNRIQHTFNELRVWGLREGWPHRRRGFGRELRGR